MQNLKQKLGVAAAVLAGSLAIASAAPVVFNVNMSVQTALGTFNAGNGDLVAVLGLNGDWSAGIDMAPSANPDIYTVTTDLDVGSWPNYKFVIKPASTAWIWENLADNRWFQVPAGGTNLPVVYFGNVTNVPVSTVQITFQVSMELPILQGQFNPAADSVSAFGSFDNWSTTGLLLTNVPGTSNYVGTLTSTTLTTNTVVYYKYAINGYSGAWEGNVGPGGAQNRSVTVTSANQVFPLDRWNNAAQITFQLSMRFAILQGQFNPGSDYVSAFGSFDNWSTTGLLLTNVPGTSNYAGILTTLPFATNTVVYYKYAINGSGGAWEGNVGPGGTPNRSFTFTNTTQILPLDYWNNVTNLASIPVGFRVNLAVEDAFGVFTPGLNTAFVNGDWNWSGSAVQLSQVESSDVYTGTVALAIAPGTTVNYKYTLDGGLIWENDGVGPAGARNHQFVLNTATNLPMDYFNNYRDLGPLFISQQGNQTALTWLSGTNVNNRIRLQNSASLSGGWSDVPNTQGQSAFTNNFGPGPMFFRITGP